MSDMSIQKAYRVMQAHCGIEKGDMVKILRIWREGEMGSCCTMSPGSEMAEFVGIIGKADIYSDHITVVNSDGLYVHVPFFCLELVEKAPKATYLPSLDVIFEKNGLTVGGTFISTDTIKRNLDLDN